MHAIDKKETLSLMEKVAIFAGKEIATRHDLHNIDDFPRDIWSLCCMPSVNRVRRETMT
jgi:maltoporin